MSPAPKYVFLESIRGLAAAAVVAGHWILTFGLPAPWPVLVNLAPAGAVQTVTALLSAPVAVAYHGRFAVQLFFVLSGFVLSLSYFRRGDPMIAVSGAFRRYFRLTLPCLASVVLSWALFSGSLYGIRTTEALTAPNLFLSEQFRFVPGFLDAVRDGLVGLYRLPEPDTRYNIVLWTIGLELYGSFFVFGFLLFFGRLRHRWIFYIVATAALYKFFFYYYTFLLGVLLCDLYISTLFFRRIEDRLGRGGRVVLATALLMTGCWLAAWDLALSQLHWSSFALLGDVTRTVKIAQPLGACAMLCAFLVARPLQETFARPFFAWLGRMSFPLYLLHLLVIFSVGCSVFNILVDRNWSYSAAIAVAAVATVPVLALACEILSRLADQPALRLGHWLWGLVVRTFRLRRTDA